MINDPLAGIYERLDKDRAQIASCNKLVNECRESLKRAEEIARQTLELVEHDVAIIIQAEGLANGTILKVTPEFMEYLDDVYLPNQDYRELWEESDYLRLDDHGSVDKWWVYRIRPSDGVLVPINIISNMRAAAKSHKR